MSEQNLNITVSVSGAREADALWEKFAEGKATLNEITQLKKELNATFKTLQVGTAEWNTYAGKLARVNDLQRDVRIQTKAGHEEYFKLGLEVRQLILGSGVLTGNMGKLGNALGASVTNALGLKAALLPLGVTLGPIAIGIAAVASAFATLSASTKDADQELKDFKKTSQDVAAEGVAGISVERARREADIFQRMITKAEEELRAGKEQKLQIKQLPSILGLPAMTITAKGDAMPQEEQEALKKQIVVWTAFLDERKRFIAAIEQQDEEALRKQGEKEEAGKGRLPGKIGTSASAFGLKVPKYMTEKEKREFAQGGPMQIGGPVKLGKEVRTQVDLTFQEAMQGTQALENSFGAAMSTMSAGVTGQLGGAFAKMFGGANTMLGSFVASFTEAFARFALKSAAMAIPGLGFLAPFMAAGGPVSAGRPYIVGEQGPELFVPQRGGEIVSNAKMARWGGSASAAAMQPIVLETRIRGNDIVLVQTKAGLARNGRVM